MTCRFHRLACVIVGGIAAVTSFGPHRAAALDTQNVIFGVDGMVINHAGLFRNGTPNDGFNTFQFGPIQYAAGTQGRYKSFYAVKTATGACCLSHRDRLETFTPEHWLGTDYGSVAPIDMTNDFFPIVDRAAFGQVFDPSEYELEVIFKPNLGSPFPPAQQNQVATFNVSMDQHYGFVFDAEAGIYKRATEQIFYTIGTAENPVNTWYAAAPKDAQGFASWKVPISTPSFSQRSFYYNFGDGTFRTDHTLSGGGRVFNETTMAWEDSNVGYGDGFQNFGGGPSDPARPGSKLNTPNGVSLLAFGNTEAEFPLSLEVKSIAIQRISKGPIAARLDALSGLSYRFGSGFTRGPNLPPIEIPGGPVPSYLPRATDQISRFDESGMTNLIFNMRTPDDPNEVHRFFLRHAPGPNTFDGTNATVNIRARLTEPLTNPGVAQSLTIVAKDLDGNDMVAGEGGDEYTHVLALNQFNTATFTTISVPLSTFALSPFVPTVGGVAGSGPFGFANPGDGLRSDFNLYEFGGLLPSNSGNLRLELEYMEIRLPSTNNSDFNNDGLVNGTDFLIWQRGNGLTGQTSKANGDANGDGLVNGVDLGIWKSRFGLAPGVPVAGAIPEPAGLALAGLGIAALATARRRK